MVAEAVIIELFNGGRPMSYTVADGTAIAKGTILTMTDPRTAIAATGAGAVVAGIAAQAKVASDGQTRLAVYTDGIFDLTCVTGGSATLGTYVRSAAADNTITVCTTLDMETGKAIGRALETGSGNEVIAVRVNL